VPKATKRERQRQNKEARRAAMMEAEKRRKRNRAIRNGGIVLVLVVGLAVLFSALNSDDNNDNTSASATKNGCSTQTPPKPTSTTLAAAPEMTIDPAKTYTAVMKTSCGDITMTLDAATAPQTVNSFVALARSGFYDGTLFHRIVTDFVDQGGDPTGTGGGGPGYTLPDEPPADGYQAGSVAMANSGSGTTGSQFFLVVSDSGAKGLGTSAPFQYSALGTMDAAGLKVAKKINTFGSADLAGEPTQKIYVLSITISESGGADTTTSAPTTVAP
jgi:peptidyl-prolyl cis-trans isomerase B (cyclophilin B)